MLIALKLIKIPLDSTSKMIWFDHRSEFSPPMVWKIQMKEAENSKQDCAKRWLAIMRGTTCSLRLGLYFRQWSALINFDAKSWPIRNPPPKKIKKQIEVRSDIYIKWVTWPSVVDIALEPDWLSLFRFSAFSDRMWPPDSLWRPPRHWSPSRQRISADGPASRITLPRSVPSSSYIIELRGRGTAGGTIAGQKERHERFL